jgi:hypothetical protein
MSIATVLTRVTGVVGLTLAVGAGLAACGGAQKQAPPPASSDGAGPASASPGAQSSGSASDSRPDSQSAEPDATASDGSTRPGLSASGIPDNPFAGPIGPRPRTTAQPHVQTSERSGASVSPFNPFAR